MDDKHELDLMMQEDLIKQGKQCMVKRNVKGDDSEKGNYSSKVQGII